jgi:hypothetical protein
VSLALILTYVGGALVFLAFVFLLIGAIRTKRLPVHGMKTGVAASNVGRLLAIRRADWRCARHLLYLAVLLMMISLTSTGAFFTEPSGNVAGGALLIGALVGPLCIVVLVARHRFLSRALRDLESAVGNDVPSPEPREKHLEDIAGRGRQAVRKDLK